MLDKEESIGFIESVLGEGTLSNGGLNISVVCPFCLKKKGDDYSNRKLVIRTDDHKCHCWVCNYKARNLQHILRIKARDVGFEVMKQYEDNFLRIISPEKIKGLSLNLEYLEDYFDEIENVEVEKPEMPNGITFLAEHYEDRKSNYYVNRHIQYLEERGLGDIESLWRWKFCIAPQEDKEYAWRILIPSFDSDGELNFFTGRSIHKNSYMKYLNCIASKKTIIFNEYLIDWTQPVMLVEGPFDTFKLRLATTNVVPILGKRVTENFKIFQKIVQNKTPVILALDPGERELQNKTAELFKSYEINVSTLEYPGWVDDLGSITETQALEIYSNMIQKYDDFSELEKSIWRIT